jgi:hypothetical protein
MSISKKIFGFVFVKEDNKKENKLNEKSLTKEIAFILPYPKKNNTQNFSRICISDYKAESKKSFFEGVEGLNVKERKFYN